ncbi:Nitric oxide reductase [Enhygromyxa salina]|uniref:Nitric oxide reductase n=1 Tax=Enhygromyxa salina TaxID=215803 RepID=A0A2S9YG15_9BACT|nr:MBL fold metallo-hydrolase [Enhygromyxa salina]PRQ04045.1 Nitric oxide reductase [Enhygromyxa salina]
MSEVIDSIEIAPGTFWVGKREPEAIFFANPYLRIFRSDDGGKQVSMLIDPGSSSDFAVVSAKLTALLGSLKRVSAIFINHQDPDVGTSAPALINRFAPKATILCSEATWRLIVHLNLPRENYVDVDRFKRGMRLATGDVLMPVPSPFCHFRGAVMLYDPSTRVLFSGDLFGGLTDASASGIWADESDWRGMRAFHQLYMPANQAVRATIERIRALDPFPEIIAPQHGRVIRGPLLQEFMERLEQLPVGLDIIDEGDDSLDAWNHVLTRVLETARMLLGPHAEIRLADARELEDSLDFGSGTPRVTHIGRWTIGKVIEHLSRGEPAEIANPIKFEAIAASEELGLPAPDIGIEAESEEVDTGLF